MLVDCEELQSWRLHLPAADLVLGALAHVSGLALGELLVLIHVWTCLVEIDHLQIHQK